MKSVIAICLALFGACFASSVMADDEKSVWEVTPAVGMLIIPDSYKYRANASIKDDRVYYGCGDSGACGYFPDKYDGMKSLFSLSFSSRQEGLSPYFILGAFEHAKMRLRDGASEHVDSSGTYYVKSDYETDRSIKVYGGGGAQYRYRISSSLDFVGRFGLLLHNDRDCETFGTSYKFHIGLGNEYRLPNNWSIAFGYSHQSNGSKLHIGQKPNTAFEEVFVGLSVPF